MIEVEDLERKVRRRYTERDELGYGPVISASTMISSRLRRKGLESFVIEDQRGAPQGLRALARKHYRPAGVLARVTDGIEGRPTRGAIPNDPCRTDLRAPRLDRHDVDQADELVGEPRTDLRPSPRLGCASHELFGRIH